MKFFTTIFSNILFLMTLAALSSCNPEDRSGEQPLPPTVKTLGYEIWEDSCLLRGEVTASPNSDLKICGFRYGNDTLRREVKCEQADFLFQAFTKRLYPGKYFAVAFAKNGIGEGIATDTLWFEMEP